MKRRSFLQLLGLGAVGATVARVLPKPALAEVPKYVYPDGLPDVNYFWKAVSMERLPDGHFKVRDEAGREFVLSTFQGK